MCRPLSATLLHLVLNPHAALTSPQGAAPCERRSAAAPQEQHAEGSPQVTRTYSQRYFVCDEYWKPGAPIFFYLGNEADVLLCALNLILEPLNLYFPFLSPRDRAFSP